MNLWADFLTNEQRALNKWTHYFPAYESHRSRFRNRTVIILEIGCGFGGLRREGTFIELCKSLIDQLHAVHTGGGVPETEFSKSTTSIHFYDSLVVFERGRYLRKHPLRIGKWPGEPKFEPPG